MQLSNLCLGLFFAPLFVLHSTRNPSSRLLVALAPMGRMALTNYLLHSFLMTWLMYGYGMGLASRTPGIVSLFLATSCLYLVPMAFSWVWLREFYFGPLEWMWRSLTYGKIQPLRRATRRF